VIQAATHDTASAVLAVPALDEDFLYLSSGTWSLMGVEAKQANCSEESRRANLTNEGGYEYRFRFLKNIMGLWMIQSVRHEWNDRYSFAELCSMAEKCDDFLSRVDANDAMFLSPDSMIGAIQEFCRSTGQRVPKTEGEIAAVIYKSLALCYGNTVREIETITGKAYGSIHIVGGGSKADYLNQLTANATGKTIYAGPDEATAIGNIAVQMLKDAKVADLSEARKVIYESFAIKKFEPK
jgi:rhamnulokinase